MSFARATSKAEDSGKTIWHRVTGRAAFRFDWDIVDKRLYEGVLLVPSVEQWRWSFNEQRAVFGTDKEYMIPVPLAPDKKPRTVQLLSDSGLTMEVVLPARIDGMKLVGKPQSIPIEGDTIRIVPRPTVNALNGIEYEIYSTRHTYFLVGQANHRALHTGSITLVRGLVTPTSSINIMIPALSRALMEIALRRVEVVPGRVVATPEHRGTGKTVKCTLPSGEPLTDGDQIACGKRGYCGFEIKRTWLMDGEIKRLGYPFLGSHTAVLLKPRGDWSKRIGVDLAPTLQPEK